MNRRRKTTTTTTTTTTINSQSIVSRSLDRGIENRKISINDNVVLKTSPLLFAVLTSLPFLPVDTHFCNPSKYYM